MKIIIVGSLGHSFNETCDEVHMTNILQNFGHQVYDYNSYDVDHLLSGKGWTNDYGRVFAPPPPSVQLIVVFKGGLRGADDLKKLKEMAGNPPVVYWCPDLMENCGNDLPRNPCAYTTPHLELAQEADFYFSKELGWRKEYEQAKVNFIYFPTNLAPSYIYNRHLPRNNDEHFLNLCGLTEKEYPVVFTGTWTDIGENRPEFLKKLDERIDNLHIFSYNPSCWQERGFKHTHGGLWDDNYKYLIARSRINIALDWRTDIEGYWSDRINQIQMCGGFVLAKYVKGMEREFGADGVNLAYWATLEELLEKIDYYLTSAYDEREMIAVRGCDNAQFNHAAEDRVKEMLTIVKYGTY